jgi:hypothetical protein
MGQVTVWKMTEEERLAYIEKYPIIPTKKERAINFDSDGPDYKWRHEQATEASQKARKK